MAIIIHKGQTKANAKITPQNELEAKLANVVIRKPDRSGDGLSLSDPRDRYSLEEVIGEGGSGRVFRAYDNVLEMEVAIKVLSPKLVKDKEAISSIKREVKISLHLTHKHILRIYNLEKSGDKFFIIMELLKGKTISALMEKSQAGLRTDFVVPVVQIVSDVLDYAHRHGVLHKDITPANIFLTDEGIVKVIDFGVATMMGAGNDSKDDTVIGTPIYMSPEQLRGEDLDGRTDIYSLGVVVCQMLTGRVVSTPGATIEDLAFSPHPPIQGLPPQITGVLEKATAFKREERYDTADEFQKALTYAVLHDV